MTSISGLQINSESDQVASLEELGEKLNTLEIRASGHDENEPEAEDPILLEFFARLEQRSPNSDFVHDFKKKLMEEEIEGDLLFHLTKEELREMGVSKIGHRLAIKSIIDDLRGVSLGNSGRFDATNPVGQNDVESRRLPLPTLTAAGLGHTSQDDVKKTVSKKDEEAEEEEDVSSKSKKRTRRKKNCTKIHSRDVESPSSPTLYISTLDGTFYELDTSSGALKWKIKEDKVVSVPNAFQENQKFFPDPLDGSLYIVNRGNIEKLQHTIPEMVNSSPMRTRNGLLYAD